MVDTHSVSGLSRFWDPLGRLKRYFSLCSQCKHFKPVASGWLVACIGVTGSPPLTVFFFSSLVISFTGNIHALINQQSKIYRRVPCACQVRW